MGLDLRTIGADLAAMVGGNFVNRFNIEGRSYKAYKSIAGRYEADGFTLAVEHVQGDPFAEPSRLRVLLT